ncbi:protein kinase domain-containing protein [Couchioplanes caeruleus]|uniref:non-specific serine/threonine protein kinase n=2 Tax=Couchioplanes caeruleus TaxID=56438 RepID=A0A1K0GGH7_9ACTN|nr:serine/threonine-protein kinase [Couchioplanes caeruleus]OJF09964.1 hypothetical protein BG844_34760 [Couchioplanes caeruleus subsp. caeruleus]ROP28715.1 serine/threonine protein kinase [Couchioplanes caeruleus]
MSSPENVHEPLAGSVLVAGRYRLIERIGSGGMGVVWLAHDEVLQRRVAVKELRHSWGSSDRSVAAGRERSLREARAAAALRHPHIVAVYDIAAQDGQPWIVMEFVPGRSLKEIVAEDGPMPVERAVDIGLQLLSALRAAHAVGITHRDVKPANVLISADGAVRLTDFGLATLPDAETLTETGAIIGTPGYLAPEQAKGLPPGPPADVFGLGATLYYAIEGVGPFQREAYLPTLVAYARHDIRAPRRAEALAPTLLRLLAADPVKRPTAEQARKLLLGGAVRRPILSRRRLIATGVLTGAAIAAGAAGRWWRPEWPSRAGAASPSPPPSPSGVGAVVWQRDDLYNPVEVGSLLIGAAADGARAVDAATGEVRWLWRSDDAQYVYYAGDRLVFVGGRDGGRALDVATGRDRGARGQGFASAVDGLVLTGEKPRTLIAYDVVTGRRLWQVAGRGEFDGQIHLSPSGVLCAAVSSATTDGPSYLYGIEPRTGDLAWRTLMTEKGAVLGPWDAGKDLYAVTIDKDTWKLSRHDAASGERRWEVSLVDVKKEASAWIDVSQVVTLGALTVTSLTDRRISLTYSGVIAVENGVARWRRPLLSPTVLATTDGRLFAATYDSVLHELDPATGQTVWSTATPGPVDYLLEGAGMLLACIGEGVTAYPLTR